LGYLVLNVLHALYVKTEYALFFLVHEVVFAVLGLSDAVVHLLGNMVFKAS
jgi:hypothetical protein